MRKVESLNYRRALIIFGIAGILVIIAGTGIGAYIAYRALVDQNEALSSRAEILERTVAFDEARLSSSTQTASDLAQAKSALEESLNSEEQKNNLMQSQVQQISGEVGTLTKLSQTDKELLQKYSKIYFLNENYVPSNLSNIDPLFLSDKTRTIQFHTNALPYLQNMLAQAGRDGAAMTVVSGYRSFANQAAVKDGYKMLYGSGANSFSADQGYSEHQLGTAVDLTGPALNGGLTVKFASSTGGMWMAQNAYRYGFILSYPKGNSYYQYEPWHWRFVGVALAQYLHGNDLNFYDIPQRTIDSYLINIFD